MGGARELRDVPHVAVLRRDVEVAADGHRLICRRVRREVVAKPLQPGELELVLLAADGTAVGHIDAGDPNPPARRREDAALLDRVGKLRRETGPGLLDPDPRQDGDAVPTAVAVMGGLVAQGRERQGGKSGIGHLRLLQAQDVGLCVAEPLLELAETCLQGVDVPGRDAHPDSVACRRPRRNAARCWAPGAYGLQAGAGRRGAAARRLPTWVTAHLGHGRWVTAGRDS